MENGIIFDVKELTLYEGEGVNICVFCKGCPLSCVWCHNPEGIFYNCETYNGKVIGKEISSEDLIEILRKYIGLLNDLGGKIIFSGGEPLNQSDFIFEVVNGLEYNNIALDTSGFSSRRNLQLLIPLIKTVYYDFKIWDEAEHIKYTGKSNRLIKENFLELGKYQIEIVVRIPIIPNITDDKNNIANMINFISQVKNVKQIDFLLFNPYTWTKYKTLNIQNKYFEKITAYRNKTEFDLGNICINIPYRILSI